MLEFNKKVSLLVRLCARLVDYSLLFLVGVGVSLALPCEVSGWFYLYWALSLPLAWVPIQALLLSTWGTTPGKASFRCKVRNALGRRLNFRSALKRALFIGQTGELYQKPLKGLRRVLSYGLTLGLFVFTLFSPSVTDYNIGLQRQQTTTGWVHYFAKDAGFYVDFPNFPEVEAKEMEVPNVDKPVNYNEYTSQHSKNVSYSVSYIDLPKKYGFVSSKRILKGVFDVMLKADTESSLLSKEHASHKEYGTLDYRLKKGDEEVMGRLIRVGKRIFKLTVTYPPSVADQLPHKEFMASFDPAS